MGPQVPTGPYLEGASFRPPFLTYSHQGSRNLQLDSPFQGEPWKLPPEDSGTPISHTCEAPEDPRFLFKMIKVKKQCCCCCCSDAKSCLTLRPHGRQSAGILCLPLSPGGCSDSWPLRRGCHPAISVTTLEMRDQLPHMIVLLSRCPLFS